MRRQRAAAWLLVTFCAFGTACPPGGGGETATEGTTTGDSTTTGESTGDLTTTPTTGPPPPIECPATPQHPSDAPFFGDLMLQIPQVGELPCGDLVGPGMLDELDTWAVHLVYPAMEDGTADDDPTEGSAPEPVEELWHPGRKPLLVMEHGSGGQNFLQYDHILRPLALQGIIAASIQGGPSHSPPKRAARILCTARWFAARWPERNERLNCDLGFMGHSSGGQGAVVAARLRSMNLDDVTHHFDLRALVSIAPRGSSAGEFMPAQTAPYLIIQGATDEQVPDGGIALFDSVSPEGSGEPNFGKSFVWAYDIPHNAFAGLSGLAETEKGHTLATEYIVPFLQWRILGEFASQFRPFFTGEAIPSVVAANHEWWSHLPHYNKTPLIFTAFTVDEIRDGEVRRLIDTFDRDVPGQLSPAQPSEAVVAAEPAFFADRVLAGTAFPLANAANPNNQVARVDWSFDDPEPGRLSWIFTPSCPWMDSPS